MRLTRRREDVMPLEDFPEDHRARILEAVAQPRPPQRWIGGEGFQIESRAYYEWHWARGRGLNLKRASLAPATRAAVIERDGYICGLCKREVEPDDVHIDHVLPVSLGGGDELRNLQVAHSRCNLVKGARV